MAQSLRPQVASECEDATTSTKEASDRLFTFTPLSESAALMTSPGNSKPLMSQALTARLMVNRSPFTAISNIAQKEIAIC